MADNKDNVVPDALPHNTRKSNWPFGLYDSRHRSKYWFRFNGNTGDHDALHVGMH
jgi:hypothetical protein